MRHFTNYLATLGSKLRQKKLHPCRSTSNRHSHSRFHRFETLEDRLVLSWDSATLIDNGDVGHRIDIVFLGDGFVESDGNYNNTVDYYGDKVNAVLTDFFDYEPLDEYASYFNVHRVDVISNDAGIDYPNATPPVSVDTALDGVGSLTGALIGINNTKGALAAADAPDSDYTFAILNGNGRGNADPGNKSVNLTVSYTTQTYIHEFGHSLGKLGDEYDNEGSDTYTSVEPNNRNLTTFSTEGAMTTAEAKWYRWLDVDGIGLYEGGDRYFDHGIYRPSNNSIMRVGTAFDAVGREAMIIGIYAESDIRTIDTATSPGSHYDNFEFSVTPMTPETHALDIQWYVDNDPILGATGTTFNPGDLDLPLGEYTVKVVVTDNTDMVRDEDARALYMADSQEWTYRQWIQVTTADDEDGTNANALSLREALDLAADEGTHPGLDKIVFAPGVNNILLDNQLIIDSDVDVFGSGRSVLTIDAQQNGRVLSVESGVTASISNLAITGGDAGLDNGGGIYSEGDLTLLDLDVHDNIAFNGGGIYFTTGSLTVERTSITDNEAVGVDATYGGIAAVFAESLSISDSTIANNEADYVGGIGVYDTESNITNTTISSNIATGGYGGGLWYYAENPVDATLTNVTVANNDAGSFYGGGIYIEPGFDDAIELLLSNTIVADNFNKGGASDIYGTVDGASSYNMIGPGGSGGLSDNSDGNIVLTALEDSGLRPLDFYGGPTQTHALSLSSPAIDHGGDALSTELLADQRGFDRLFDEPNTSGGDGSIDIGAVEYATPRVVNVTISSTQANPYGSNPPYEFDVVVGSEEQLRTVPVGGANVVSVQFSQDVDIPSILESADQILIALNEIRVLPSSTFNYDDQSFTATWTFATPLLSAQYLLQLPDSIENFEGLALDGEWVNPGSLTANVATSVFPSGNRLAGGKFSFVFSILSGDVDRDGHGDLDDMLTVIANSAMTNATWEDADIDGNGKVELYDLLTVLGEMGRDHRTLAILADYDGDFDVDDSGTGNDEDAFWTFYNGEDDRADLNGDNDFTTADVDAFYALLDFGVSLSVEV